MKKKVKKNLIYLNLDDLQKLYGISPKLLKKLKKKRNKRKKAQKGIKFEKIKDSSQMPGVQYLNNNASNSDTQYLKDQIKQAHAQHQTD
jgi:type III secretory pathway component EscR